jgi:hypothetical protein
MYRPAGDAAPNAIHRRMIRHYRKKAILLQDIVLHSFRRISVHYLCSPENIHARLNNRRL